MAQTAISPTQLPNRCHRITLMKKLLYPTRTLILTTWNMDRNLNRKRLVIQVCIVLTKYKRLIPRIILTTTESSKVNKLVFRNGVPIYPAFQILKKQLRVQKQRNRLTKKQHNAQVAKLERRICLFKSKVRTQDTENSRLKSENEDMGLANRLLLLAAQEEYASRERHLLSRLQEVKDSCEQLRKQVPYCPVCMHNICDAVTICGHQFCIPCMVSWIKAQAIDRSTPTCPTCRASIGEPGCSAESIMTRMFDL